jgi:hypothetical protein
VIGAIHHKPGIASAATVAVSTSPCCANAAAAKVKTAARTPVFKIVFLTLELLIKKTLSLVRAKLGTVYRKTVFLQEN